MHGSTGGSWKRSDLATATEVAQPDGKPRAPRLRDLPPTTATAPAPDPTCAQWKREVTSCRGDLLVRARRRLPV